MMTTQDKLLTASLLKIQSTAALQMHWAERNFSTIELYHDLLVDYSPQTTRNSEFVFYPQQAWPVSIKVSDPKAYETSLHCLTPHLLFYNIVGKNKLSVVMGILRTLVHFCDFLFPLFGANNEVTLQIPTVYRVDHFLKTR